MQRYTSVASRSSSRNVGLLFGGLYVVSAVLWMLPPMIYRLIDPSLDSHWSRRRLSFMCREVLPVGLLGLMLGGMVFATASSLNATLNISSGVVTNDIFRRLRPASSDKLLIRVARISTVLFGLMAIGVALLIPKMGGIVNVVISVAALTGVPLYLPIIWSLFSRRQTGTSVITATLSSLGVNALFNLMPSAGLTPQSGGGDDIGCDVPGSDPVVVRVLLSVAESGGRRLVGNMRFGNEKMRRNVRMKP